jgi:pimeloyl-ACP methyl ester carboxylesterase
MHIGMLPQSSPRAYAFRWWARRILSGGLVLVIILGGIAFLAGSAARANLARRYPAPGRLVDVGGYKLHINCIGHESPTVIMEAGLNDFSVQWALVQNDVARFARVCVYDRAGFGWSEPSPHPRTSASMVDELHTLLINANVEGPYVLVGHSFGGMTMRLYAHHYPDDVAAIVLVDSAHEAQTIRIPALRQAAAQASGQFRTLAWLSACGILALAPESIPALGLPDLALSQYRAILATTRYFETALAETEGLEQSFAEVRAAEITTLGEVPLVVLSRGLRDPLPTLSQVENQQYEQAWQSMQSELVSLSSNSRQIIAAKSGHYIQLQQPGLVSGAIQEVVEAAHKSAEDTRP